MLCYCSNRNIYIRNFINALASLKYDKISIRSLPYFGKPAAVIPSVVEISTSTVICQDFALVESIRHIGPLDKYCHTTNIPLDIRPVRQYL